MVNFIVSFVVKPLYFSELHVSALAHGHGLQGSYCFFVGIGCCFGVPTTNTVDGEVVGADGSCSGGAGGGGRGNHCEVSALCCSGPSAGTVASSSTWISGSGATDVGGGEVRICACPEVGAGDSDGGSSCDRAGGGGDAGDGGGRVGSDGGGESDGALVGSRGWVSACASGTCGNV